MARRALPSPDDDEIVIEGEAEDISQIEAEVDDELGRITSEFGGDTREVEHKIKVYKVEGANMAFCFDCSPSELPITDRVRDEFGPGNYVIRVYTKKGAQQFKLTRATRLAIAKTLAPTAKAVSSDLTSALEAMAKQQHQMFEQMKQLMFQTAGKSAAPTNPMESMTLMLSMMSQMKEFIAPARDSTDQLVKVISVVKDLVPSSGGSGETNLLDIARDLLKSEAFGNAISSLTTPRAQIPASAGTAIRAIPAQQPTAGTVHPAGAAAGNVNNEEQPVGIIQDQLIRSQIKRLVQLAATDKNPSLYAEVIADQLPAQVVIEHLLQPDSIDKATEYVPEVAYYRAWFDELQAALRELFSEESPEPSAAMPVQDIPEDVAHE